MNFIPSDLLTEARPATPVRFSKPWRQFISYPFASVIERTMHRQLQFEAPRRGTSWQPFL